jgi:hypothetical protein
MIYCFSNVESFFPQGTTLGKCAEFGMAPSEPGTGVHRGEEDQTEALVALRSVKGRYSLTVAVDCPAIVALCPRLLSFCARLAPYPQGGASFVVLRARMADSCLTPPEPGTASPPFAPPICRSM